MTATNKPKEQIEAIFSKHFPDEGIPEVLDRVQKLLTFMGSLDPKLLAYSSKHNSVQSLQTGHQPSMLHQYNNKNTTQRPVQQIHLEQEIRNTLLSQITKLRDISHLEPAVRISAARKLK